MRVALVNPRWRFDGSIYFGCRHEHLPIELGATAALLRNAGHEACMIDATLDDLSQAELSDAVADLSPDATVVTTAPTYLFWRCTQPELRIPREFLSLLGGRGGLTIAVGPHGSATPAAALRKLGCDIVLRGECEEAVVAIADGRARADISGAAFRRGDLIEVTGPPRATAFTDLPPLVWPDRWVARHGHHHHRFETEGVGFGAEVEASRGCPYACSFCAKIDFRDKYRRRDLGYLLAEIDRLIAQGAGYFYFIDEIFLPWRALLEALAERRIEFGVQTRIDLWKPDMIRLLGRAGCVSVEAGVESITEAGRESLDKGCRISTEELTARLLAARDHIPFVQANLIEVASDDVGAIKAWRDEMRDAGVWANDPVPLFPYPSSPDYHKQWGEPDEEAWERAHDYYLSVYSHFSDIQDSSPSSLAELEREVS